MAGLRRTHALGLAVAIVLIYLLFFSGSETTDFRRVTEASLSRRRGVLRGSLSDADLTFQTNQQLQEILDKQKDATIATSGSEADVIGNIPSTKDKEKPKYPVDSSAAGSSAKGESSELKGDMEDKVVDNGEEMAREEFHNILKKSPIVIIFSKSYCPYSRRAKALLLETYTISPAPYVVELDLMTKPVPRKHVGDQDEDIPAPTLGRKLQDLLASLTGRRTVPNIMINAHSLGGGDDIASMDAQGTLIDEIKKMGGKRIVSVERNHEGES
ncbi:hypothetical protein LTR67_001447 [Exophiala xenobiotica]